jgi:hypothetical protein
MGIEKTCNILVPTVMSRSQSNKDRASKCYMEVPHK